MLIINNNSFIVSKWITVSDLCKTSTTFPSLGLHLLFHNHLDLWLIIFLLSVMISMLLILISLCPAAFASEYLNCFGRFSPSQYTRQCPLSGLPFLVDPSVRTIFVSLIDVPYYLLDGIFALFQVYNCGNNDTLFSGGNLRGSSK